MSNLKVSSIKISNVLGIESIEITPNKGVIEVSGHNGSGKTSIIEAIKDALGQSSYDSLLRNGADKGEVIIDCGDLLIRKVHKPNGDTLSIKGKVAGTDSMSTISSPAKVLRGLISPHSIDPVRLLSCKPKELLDVTLAAMPMVVDPKEMAIILDQGNYTDKGEHALVAIHAAFSEAYRERTGVNRDLKTANSACEQLAATIPADQSTLEEVEDAIEDNLSFISKIQSTAKRASRSVIRKYSKVVGDGEADISEMEQDIEDAKERLNAAKVEHSALIQKRDTEAELSIESELNKVDQYQADNLILSDKLSALAVTKNTRKQIKDWQDTIKESQGKVNYLNKTMSLLNEYKSTLCKDLPIDGLEIVDDRLTFKGVPFQTLNTAARVGVVIELAKLSAGKLGIIVLDNCEFLDTETYKSFIEQAQKTDLQFIVSRVEDHELEVN